MQAFVSAYAVIGVVLFGVIVREWLEINDPDYAVATMVALGWPIIIPTVWVLAWWSEG